MEPSPFRDGPPATQARIEHLEDENAALRAQLKVATSVRARRGPRRGLLAMVVLAAVVGSLGYISMARKTSPQRMRPAVSEGIAIAPLDPVLPPPMSHDTASSRARPSASSVPKGTVKPCSCVVGDPLCNCL